MLMNDSPRKPKKRGGSVIVAMPRTLDRTWVERQAVPGFGFAAELRLDFAETEQIDSAGMGYIATLHKICSRGGGKLVLENIATRHVEALHKQAGLEPGPQRQREGSVFVRTADMFLSAIEQGVEALSVLVEMLYWGTFGMWLRRDFKRGSLGEQMYQLGFRAVGIVALLSFLIGVVLSLQSAMQLRTYGAGIFLAPLIGITMVREMGPLLTAIILAGRTGSATTAEIATMEVNEEIDALRTMGINPIQFVVVPKFWAISVTMPLLTIISTSTGILGGYVVAFLYLDLSPGLFTNELTKYLHFADVNAGFIKSVVFSWLIIWIGAYYGLRVQGGAEAVGRETTSSVVTGIFIIIIADAIFSFIL